MKKLLQIGHYCATGGISIHMRRLVSLLKNDFDIRIIDESRLIDNDGVTFNLRNKQFFNYIKMMWHTDIIHIHTTITILRLIHVFIGVLFNKRVVFTVHSLSTIKSEKDMFLLRIILRFPKKVILVSKEIEKRLKLRNNEIIPAFLPPSMKNEKDLPEEILEILKKHKNKKIVISNAYRLNLHNGQDLYGVDLLLQVAEKIKKNKDDFKLIFIITSLEMNENLFNKYLDIIKKKKLMNQISLIPYPISFVKLILKSDLVIRATNTDGDAITIREALYFNKPVVASDVVARPAGTILFKNRNVNDLYIKIIENIERPIGIKENVINNYKKAYRNIYN